MPSSVESDEVQRDDSQQPVDQALPIESEEEEDSVLRVRLFGFNDGLDRFMPFAARDLNCPKHTAAVLKLHQAAKKYVSAASDLSTLRSGCLSYLQTRNKETFEHWEKTWKPDADAKEVSQYMLNMLLAEFDHESVRALLFDACEGHQISETVVLPLTYPKLMTEEKYQGMRKEVENLAASLSEYAPVRVFDPVRLLQDLNEEEITSALAAFLKNARLELNELPSSDPTKLFSVLLMLNIYAMQYPGKEIVVEFIDPFFNPTPSEKYLSLPQALFEGLEYILFHRPNLIPSGVTLMCYGLNVTPMSLTKEPSYLNNAFSIICASQDPLSVEPVLPDEMFRRVMRIEGTGEGLNLRSLMSCLREINAPYFNKTNSMLYAVVHSTLLPLSDSTEPVIDFSDRTIDLLSAAGESKDETLSVCLVDFDDAFDRFLGFLKDLRHQPCLTKNLNMIKSAILLSYTQNLMVEGELHRVFEKALFQHLAYIAMPNLKMHQERLVSITDKEKRAACLVDIVCKGFQQAVYLFVSKTKEGKKYHLSVPSSARGHYGLDAINHYHNNYDAREQNERTSISPDAAEEFQLLIEAIWHHQYSDEYPLAFSALTAADIAKAIEKDEGCLSKKISPRALLDFDQSGGYFTDKSKFFMLLILIHYHCNLFPDKIIEFDFFDDQLDDKSTHLMKTALMYFKDNPHLLPKTACLRAFYLRGFNLPGNDALLTFWHHVTNEALQSGYSFWSDEALVGLFAEIQGTGKCFNVTILKEAVFFAGLNFHGVFPEDVFNLKLHAFNAHVMKAALPQKSSTSTAPKASFHKESAQDAGATLGAESLAGDEMGSESATFGALFDGI
jgi:hypothetical protein